MLRQEKAVKRFMIVLLVMALFVALAAGPVWADDQHGSDSTWCYVVGDLYSTGTGYNWQYHLHDGGSKYWTYAGIGTRVGGWGYESGWQTVDFVSSKLISYDAYCYDTGATSPVGR
ncbi:MAG TPA: hypothetical protein ENH33_02425 [Actinobacteria bacterium]|nr:hypothetical protein BMS3Bbin01_01176 [bacterium BMS3Bbin01]HDL48805.1 hypothetical protein [Actinomycetota bacterium]